MSSVAWSGGVDEHGFWDDHWTDGGAAIAVLGGKGQMSRGFPGGGPNWGI